MMKKINKKLFSLVACVPVVAFSVAADSGYDSMIENDLISVCKSAALNDKHGVRQSTKNIFPNTKHTSISLRKLSEGLVCNGMDVTEFARVYGAADTYEMFQRFSPQRTKIEIKDIEVSYQRESLDNITAILK